MVQNCCVMIPRIVVDNIFLYMRRYLKEYIKYLICVQKRWLQLDYGQYNRLISNMGSADVTLYSLDQMQQLQQLLYRCRITCSEFLCMLRFFQACSTLTRPHLSHVRSNFALTFSEKLASRPYESHDHSIVTEIPVTL